MSIKRAKALIGIFLFVLLIVGSCFSTEQEDNIAGLFDIIKKEKVIIWRETQDSFWQQQENLFHQIKSIVKVKCEKDRLNLRELTNRVNLSLNRVNCPLEKYQIRAILVSQQIISQDSFYGFISNLNTRIINEEYRFNTELYANLGECLYNFCYFICIPRNRSLVSENRAQRLIQQLLMIRIHNEWGNRAKHGQWDEYSEDSEDSEDGEHSDSELSTPDEPPARRLLPLFPIIPQGHKSIWQKFLTGVLIYKPNLNNDDGLVELPIAELAKPLEGTFDLSNCGDAGRFLSISTGYRKAKKHENEYKVEIWIAPKFLIEKDIATTASHFKPIMDEWQEDIPFGLFWTWGGGLTDSRGEVVGDDSSCYEHLTTSPVDEISRNSLYKSWELTTVHCFPLCCIGCRRPHEKYPHSYPWFPVDYESLFCNVNAFYLPNFYINFEETP
jgi:hypothetical protein